MQRDVDLASMSLDRNPKFSYKVYEMSPKSIHSTSEDSISLILNDTYYGNFID